MSAAIAKTPAAVDAGISQLDESDHAAHRDTGELAELGVLLVHGIGEQQQGDTLSQAGAALVDWLNDWCAAHNGHVTIEDAVLTGSRLGSEIPAHARLNVTVGTAESRQERRWLIAESWWASAFNPPGFRELSRWLLTSGSWAIISHVASFCHRSVRGWMLAASRAPSSSLPWLAIPLRNSAIIVAAGLTWTLSFVGTILLVCLFQLCILIISAASLIPIPPMRNTLKAILLRVQGILGDSFVFSSRSLIRGTVASQVLRDLKWLEQRCQASVILAHSQGAAVSFEALKTAQSTKLARLVTYGAGLLKLQELRAHSGSGRWPRLIRWLVLLTPLYVFAFPEVCRAVTRRFSNSWEGFQKLVRSFDHDPSLLFSRSEDLLGLLLLAPLLLFAAIGFVRTLWQEARKSLTDTFGRMQFRPDFRWLDVYGSHDPVPNGPSLGEHVERYESVEIVNRKSLMCDHAAYWENRDEFIPLVVRELSEVSGLREPAAPELLRQTASSRRTRVNWLLGLRCLVILAVAAPILLKAPQVRAFGQTNVAPVLWS